MSFMGEVIDLMQKESRPGTAVNYLNSSRSFAAYLTCLGRKDVPLRMVDAELLAGYQDWLLSEGRSGNTIACHMRHLRSFNIRAALIASGCNAIKKHCLSLVMLVRLS